MNVTVSFDMTAQRTGETAQKNSGQNEAASLSELAGKFHHLLSASLIGQTLQNGDVNKIEKVHVTDTDTEVTTEMEEMEEMEDLLSLQISLLNKLQELIGAKKQEPSELPGELPEEYFVVLEQAFLMLETLANYASQQQKSPLPPLDDMKGQFLNLSQRVVYLVKEYLVKQEKQSPSTVDISKEQKGMKDLLLVLEQKLKVQAPLRAIQPERQDPMIKSMSLPTWMEASQVNGPVSIQTLQQPKQAVLQWTIDTTTVDKAREQLLQKLEGILSKTQTRFVGGNQAMTIRLTPEHLGTLHIKLQETQQGLIAKLIVHSKTAASLLESQMATLKQNLASSNINVDKLDVVFHEQEQRHSQQQKESTHERHQERNFSDQKKNGEDASSFEELLLEELEIEKSEGV